MIEKLESSISAENGSRTRTPLQALASRTSMSTYSIISAYFVPLVRFELNTVTGLGRLSPTVGLQRHIFFEAHDNFDLPFPSLTPVVLSLDECPI